MARRLLLGLKQSILEKRPVVTIEIGNSYSKINNLPSGPFNRLRKLLSYSPDKQAAYFSGGYSTLRYCIDKQGNFPSGHLKRVEAFLKEEKTPYVQLSDIDAWLKIKSVGHYPVFPFPLYPDQELAAEYAGCRGRVIISAPTGSGKSIIIARIIANLSVRTLVVVPSLSIKEQLKSVIKSIMGDMSNIVIENIDSPNLKKLTDFDCLIIDEAHHVAAKTYQKLNKSNWAGIYYRVFLTATPFRNQTEETLLFEGIAGTDVFTLTYKDAVKKGYIVPLEAFYIELPKRSTDAVSWQQVYNELIVNNADRNAIIAQLLLNLSIAGKSTLCLVKEIKHGNNLSDLTGIAFANGQDEDTRVFIGAFASNKIKSLIGTTGVVGEGVDTKPCEFAVIAGLGKAKSALMQQFGRAVRTFPGKETGKIILFKDKSHKFTIRHYNEQVKLLLDEYGIVPIKLEI